MRALLPYTLLVIAAALVMGAAVILSARLPPVAINLTIVARDITVSGDY